MESGNLFRAESDVAVPLEPNFRLSTQLQATVITDIRENRGFRVHVERFRLQPHEAKHKGRIGRVPLAGCPKTSHQIHSDPCDPRGSISRWESMRMKSAAALIGPTVCDEDGPMPTRKMSKTLIAMIYLLIPEPADLPEPDDFACADPILTARAVGHFGLIPDMAFGREQREGKNSTRV